MRSQMILVGLTALISTALAASKPPSAFFLQAEAIKGGSKQFNNLYMTIESIKNNEASPVFYSGSDSGQFFSLKDPEPTSNGTFYSLKTSAPSSQSYTAQMAYNTANFADWQPVNFLAKQNTDANPSKMETGFYIEGTNPNMHLMWTNNYNNPSKGDFQGWVLCEWWLAAPQLFFLTKWESAGLKVPSSCAVVNLRLIPLEPSS